MEGVHLGAPWRRWSGFCPLNTRFQAIAGPMQVLEALLGLERDLVHSSMQLAGREVGVDLGHGAAGVPE